MPQYVKGLTPVDYWTMSSVATILLFFSILLHELAHSIVAKRYNIPVKSITLFIFGGVSDIAKERGLSPRIQNVHCRSPCKFWSGSNSRFFLLVSFTK